MKGGRKTNDQEMEWRNNDEKEAKNKEIKINQREKLNRDKVIRGREGDKTRYQ